jgi:hypothetical protein
MPDQFAGVAFTQIKVMMGSREDGAIYLVDALEEGGGRVWLVPHWLESPDEGLMYPTRIILMNPLRYQRVDMETHRYLLNYGIPKGVLDGDPYCDPHGPKGGYVLIERPKIALPSGKGIH